MRGRHSKFAKAIIGSLIIILYFVMMSTFGYGVGMMCGGHRFEGLVLMLVALVLCPIIFAINYFYENKIDN